MSEFISFRKIPRLSRDMVITEKIDGTNASVLIVAPPLQGHEGHVPEWLPDDAVARVDDLWVFAGKRTGWTLPGKSDNYGWGGWVRDHAVELVRGLGPGRHFGEWWGAGIQRRYGQAEKRFSLFNVGKWLARRTWPWDPGLDPEFVHPKTMPRAYPPACCSVVPELYRGPFDTAVVESVVRDLRAMGSVAAPGFMDPEGVVVLHEASGALFKKMIKGDERGKG
jgi:hypothetical protein